MQDLMTKPTHLTSAPNEDRMHACRITKGQLSKAATSPKKDTFQRGSFSVEKRTDNRHKVLPSGDWVSPADVGSFSALFL